MGPNSVLFKTYFCTEDMKTLRILFSLFALWALQTQAAFVNPDLAKSVAKQFVLSEYGLSVKPEGMNLHKQLKSGENTLIYVFNISQSGSYGFILVSAEDFAHPILGYSLGDTLNFEMAPEHMLAWISDYEKRISWGINSGINATEDIKTEWEQLSSNKSLIGKRRGSVSPIIKAKWNQVPYYNDLCPLDGTKRSVVGCVATAMAQVIHHWQYPSKGSGFHSYSHSKLGTISANFGNTTYNYGNMPTAISSRNSDVALLNFHCGVAVEMNYSAQSSGAYVISAASPSTHCAEYALKKYFNYPASVSGQLRDNYSTSSWKGKVNSDLDNGRPIIYAGFGNGGGHAFIFDGYDNAGKYHINWGWGGAYNGYFEIDALNPDGLGTGGGTGSYNSGHQAIFGIEAPDNTQTDASISMYANLSVDATSVSYGQPFKITTKAVNFSGKDFAGSLAVAVFDDSFNFVEFVGEMNNLSLKDNYAFTGLTFESAGSLIMLPGDYHLYLCYKNNGGDWKIANDYSSYTNYAPLKVFYYNDIELYDDLKVTSGKIQKGQTTSVSFNVANTGTSTFRGTYAVSLFNMDGSYAQLIGSQVDNNGLPSNNYYTSNINLTSPAIDVEPGTYLMAVQYQESGSSSWYLVGSYYKVNPIKVIVEEAPIKPDAYENNNEVVDAYKLNLTYTNNQTNWSSNITNIHLESDVDYYRIDFEKDYQYTLDVKVSDLNKTFDGKTYGLDARFSLSDDGVFWSSAFTNEMTQSLKVNGKDKSYVLIRVVPAFAGLTGDYNLNVNLSRESTLSIENLKNSARLYPNPTQQFVTIEGKSFQTDDTYAIYNINGTQLQSGSLKDGNSINVEKLAAGVYFLSISGIEGVQNLQFIKE